MKFHFHLHSSNLAMFSDRLLGNKFVFNKLDSSTSNINLFDITISFISIDLPFFVPQGVYNRATDFKVA